MEGTGEGTGGTTQVMALDGRSRWRCWTTLIPLINTHVSARHWMDDFTATAFCDYRDHSRSRNNGENSIYNRLTTEFSSPLMDSQEM